MKIKELEETLKVKRMLDQLLFEYKEKEKSVTNKMIIKNIEKQLNNLNPVIPLSTVYIKLDKDMIISETAKLMTDIGEDNYKLPDLENLYFKVIDLLECNKAVILGYDKRYNGYNEVINNFLLTIIIKILYVDKVLNEEELDMIRNKFLKLYNSGYNFEYYEDNLYDLEDVKVYKKAIEK